MTSAKILEGGTVITFDDVKDCVKVLPNTSVLVLQGIVKGFASHAEELLAIVKTCNGNVDDVEVVDVKGKIVSPGFVNTHFHSWQTVYRTIGPDVVLANYFDWLSQMSPSSVKAFKPDDVYISSLEGYLEGLNAGVTSFVEHASNNWDESVVTPGYQAAVDSGARVWWCFDVAPNHKFSEKRQYEKLGEIASRNAHRVSLGLALDSLGAGLCSDDPDSQQVLHFKEMAKNFNLQVFTMHHMGGPWPQANDATSPFQVCHLGLQNIGVPIIFSHAPFMTAGDMRALRQHDLFVSITPESECHYGHGQITGRLIADQASLGIDTSWTFSGDMLGQARLWLQTVRNTSFTKLLTDSSKRLPNASPMEVEQAFLLGTRQGGRALRRHDIGVLKVGGKADIVVFNGESPNMLGWSNPVAAVVLHANTGDVQHVLVDGDFVKRNFQLVLPGIPEGWVGVKERFLEASSRIQAEVKTPPPLPGKLWGIGELGDVEKSTTIRQS